METSAEHLKPGPRDCPIVGIGASAGGLEAFTHLLEALPIDTGMAFVLIQHLDPRHASFLTEALTGATRMPVTQVNDGTPVAPNHVYVIPPNCEMAVLQGQLTLLPRTEGSRPPMPIDFFLRSLALERRNAAIGVILSGTASDGSEGLRAIKVEGGITFAQEPTSARFPGMPRSAVDAGVVDHCLPLTEIANQLVRLSRHAYVASPATAPTLAGDAPALKRILALVRNVVGVDFSEYKTPSVERRLARRMALHHIDGPDEYLRLLEKEPAEAQALCEDILIHVTSFFRDAKMYESLKEQVFPEILKSKAADAPFRMWVAGCSTGEEVYSLAISLLEVVGTNRPVQIFGSDLSERAVAKARAATYAEGNLREVSEERRERFFERVDGGFRIVKAVRDVCVFVQHDLARDPPFSRLDLLSCRNVLIYFAPALQQRLLPILHYALNQPGFLLLGRTESVAGFDPLFTPFDKANKIYARSSLPSALRFAPRLEKPSMGREAAPQPGMGGSRGTVEVSQALDRFLLERFAPAGVLVNARMEILQFRGKTGAYLEPAPGDPQHNVLKMAREGLLSPLRSALTEVVKTKEPVTQRGVEVQHEGHTRICDVTVMPFEGRTGNREALYLVLFERPVERSPTARRKSSKHRAKGADQRFEALEEELSATKQYLESVVDEHGRANEDLSAANEELVSGNEELQSMNEELETAKEELQSTNEELTTVNDELQSRNQETAQINSDLVNLLGAVDIPILILDSERRIRRFTPKARTLLNVLPTDVGRPLSDINPNLSVDDLDRQAREVIETAIMKESELQDRMGHWYRLQIRPYKNLDNRIDGAILSLVDIDDLKLQVARAERATDEAQHANRAKDDFLATLSHELRSPLGVVVTTAQILRRGEVSEAKVKRAADAIERSAKLQVQLIEDLLDVARIASGKLKMELEPVELASIVRAAVASAVPAARRKGIQVEEVVDDVGVASADPARIQQVVTNLLTNAIKFTPGEGRISLALARVAGDATLTVTDTGIGIEPGFLPHVFDRFAQQDSSTSRRSTGLGIGLAIVRHLVELHGGTVRAESAGVGKGATFTVTLPLLPMELQADGDANAMMPAPSENGRRLDGLRVLVVDDDVATRDSVVQLVEQAGAQARVAASAPEALERLQAFKPDVLVSDIAMPDEDGYSLIRRVRELGRTVGGDLPALALSAMAGPNDEAKARAAGFQAHLAKPFDVDEFLDRLLELVGGNG